MPPLRSPRWALCGLPLVALLALPVCRSAAPAPTAPALGVARRDQPWTPPKRDHLRIVVIGDTGTPNPQALSVRDAVRAERKDLVVVTGDLVYPLMPECDLGRAEGSARELLDSHLAGTIGDLGAPTLLVLGNHDVGHVDRDEAREACVLDYAAIREDLLFPDLSYSVDLGVAVLVVLNSNALDDPQAALMDKSFEGHEGWRIGISHHVLRTFHDKEDEDIVRPWLARHGLGPDLWMNGHAHTLQFGVYGGVAAVTSGAVARTRESPACPPACGEGQLFGAPGEGYAVVELTPDKVDVVYKDPSGKRLYFWSRDRQGASGP